MNHPFLNILKGEMSAVGPRQATEGHPRIIRRPDISGGEPIIRGTRI